LKGYYSLSGLNLEDSFDYVPPLPGNALSAGAGVWNCGHRVLCAKQRDFPVGRAATFENGGKNKGFGKIREAENAFVAADDIEMGFGNKIPLWLFGFLY
jgi:hypothetical protein